jgi:hypothetical protein
MMDIDALREAVQVEDEDLTNDEARYLFVLLDCAQERAAGLDQDLEAARRLLRIAERRADVLQGAAETAQEALSGALDGP